MGITNNDSVWKEVLESIKVEVSPAIFSTWFSQTQLYNLQEIEGDRCIADIGCTSAFVRSTVETRYLGLIQDALSKSLNKKCDVIFSIREGSKKTTNNLPSPLFDLKEEDDKGVNEALAKSHIRPGFTFDNFAVSSSNQMAWAAAQAVNKDPGSAYNPLFLWGGVGVGKTHLAMAIAHEIIKKDASSKILFCTGEDFTNDIVQGIRNKTTQEFRDKYRKLKGLFIDDVQFIAGKDAVQEEFFHTFNTVTSAGGQIVLISDRPPSEIAKLEERLRSRFEAGLIVDISAPDFELRCAIVLIKSRQKGIELGMDQVQLIAGNIDSARRIEGFMVRLYSESAIRKEPITTQLIENLLGKNNGQNEGAIRKVSPNQVISTVADYYSLGKRQLLGSLRAQTVALPRQILMYILRVDIGMPLEEVGRVIGGRDHTTVMHAVEKITKLNSQDANIREDIRLIKNKL